MRRHLFVLVLLLVGGAIVNVAVAWGCAAWMPLPARPRGMQVRQASQPEQDLWLQGVPSGFSTEPLLSSNVSSWGIEATYLSADRTAGLITVTYHNDGVVNEINLAPTNDPVAFDHAMFVRSGWPLPALHGTRWINGRGQSGQFSVAAALQVPPKPGSATLVQARPYERGKGADLEFRIIPAGVIPAGFAINTVFHAAILWVVFVAPFALRRRRRIKRGLCPKCAYPVGTSEVCTECGASLPR